MAEKKRISIRVDEELHKTLRKLKEKTGISISSWFEKGAKQLISNYSSDIKHNRTDKVIENFLNEE